MPYLDFSRINEELLFAHFFFNFVRWKMKRMPPLIDSKTPENALLFRLTDYELMQQ